MAQKLFVLSLTRLRQWTHQPWASRCSWTTTPRSLHRHLCWPGFLGVEVREHLEAQRWGTTGLRHSRLILACVPESFAPANEQTCHPPPSARAYHGIKAIPSLLSSSEEVFLVNILEKWATDSFIFFLRLCSASSMDWDLTNGLKRPSRLWRELLRFPVESSGTP